MGEHDIQNGQAPVEADATAIAKGAAAPVHVETFAVPREKLEAPDFSNGIRLTGREWLCVGIVALLIFFAVPRLWKTLEPFPLEADYRMPHDIASDYWLYERHAEQSAAHYDTVLIGDSVVWGEYVKRDETLSHYLNQISGEQRYANLGLDGTNPLALEGLVEHYAGSVRGKMVMLQCNPLWLTSPNIDLLQDEHGKSINSHPALIPQFGAHTLVSHEELSPRIGVVVEQHTPLAPWTNHLQQAYYDRNDIPAWTQAHPYENPVAPLTRGLPPSDYSYHKEPISWKDRKASVQDYPWGDLNTSLQWQAFQRVVATLRQRGNRVFVLVGPFNEHMLTAESRQRYQGIKATILAWLKAQDIPCAAPEPLPSELYGDASHPLAAGYEMLAHQLLEEPFFQSRDR